MKIVLFGNDVGKGGAQTTFRRTIEFLVSEGHDVGVARVCSEDLSDTKHESLKLQCSIPDVPNAKLRKFSSILISALAVRRFSPDYFISIGLARSSSLISRMLPKSTIKVAQDFIHGRSGNDRLLSVAVGAFDFIAVQSHSMIDAVPSGFRGIKPFGWLPCFPDNPVVGESIGPVDGEGGKNIAYFGRLAENKGLAELLEAFSGVIGASLVKLDIWGSGPESGNIKRICCERKLNDCVRMMGEYPSGEAYGTLLRNYDGIVVPSMYSEGLPLILIEAMAQGVPFLTTRVGAIPDCCLNNPDSLLVDPSVDGLRSGLIDFLRIISSGGFSRDRLREYYDKNFSYEVLKARWREMLAAPAEFFGSTDSYSRKI